MGVRPDAVSARSDAQITNDTPQFVGIRFQDVNIPAGAKVKDAHIKFTVDESTNYGDHGSSFTGESLHFGDWSAPLDVMIKARKSANAGPWLDPSSTNAGIASNRDCPAKSGCMNNYDCNSIALLGPHWGITMTENAACSYFEDGSFAADLKASGVDQWGDTFESWLSHESGCVANCEATTEANSDAYASCVNACPLQEQCSCGGCLCGQHPVGAGVLATVWNQESTSSVLWKPQGENIAKAQVKERRPTAMTPDLSGMINEVINLDGWAAGNSIAFVIDGVSGDADGTQNSPAIPVRTYESFDGSNTAEHAWTHKAAEYGPTLSISYCAPVECPAGSTFHSETLRVDNKLDDVEENQAIAGKSKPSAGFLYQGSSDLEIGNDPETGGAQYVGLRFQNVPIPKGAIIQGASLMLTIDESFNSDETCNPGDDNYAECRRFSEWMTAEIKMRKVADAPEWLAGSDPEVVANRDCSKARDGSGGIDSLCMPNYDCQAMMDWKPIKDYFESKDATRDGLTSCDFFTKPTGQGGVTFKLANEYALAQGIWDYTELAADTCNCDNCMCTGVPTPQVLHKAFTNEGTDSVFWSPAGEHNPDCPGSCSSDYTKRRIQFSSDFSSLMQEVIDLDGWKQGNAMALIIDGHSDFDDTPALRSYESFDGTNSAGYSWTSSSPMFGPTLYVSYCLSRTYPPPPKVAEVPSCPTGQGLYHTSVLVKGGLDDVEEAHAGPIEGFLYQGSSDLELGNHVEVCACGPPVAASPPICALPRRPSRTARAHRWPSHRDVHVLMRRSPTTPRSSWASASRMWTSRPALRFRRRTSSSPSTSPPTTVTTALLSPGRACTLATGRRPSP